MIVYFCMSSNIKIPPPPSKNKPPSKSALTPPPFETKEEKLEIRVKKKKEINYLKSINKMFSLLLAPFKKLKSILFNKIILIIIFILIFISLIVYFFSTLSFVKFTTKTPDELITEVEEISQKSMSLYDALSNYTCTSYNEKFKEYLEFLISNASSTREKMQKVFDERKSFKFKSADILLTGCKGFLECRKNHKSKKYRVKDYESYLNEVNNAIIEHKIYGDPPHIKLGEPYIPSVLIGFKLRKEEYNNTVKKIDILLKELTEIKKNIEAKDVDDEIKDSFASREKEIRIELESLQKKKDYLIQ